MLSVKALLTKILLATKQIKPINSVTQITGNFKATAANTWQYTGGILTVPAGHVYLVRVWAGWTSVKPIGVGFETATTVGGKGFPSHCIENSNGLYDGGQEHRQQPTHITLTASTLTWGEYRKPI